MDSLDALSYVSIRYHRKVWTCSISRHMWYKYYRNVCTYLVWNTFEFKVCTKIIVDSFNANACECKVLQKSLGLLTHSLTLLSWVCKISTVHLPSMVHLKNYCLSSNQESVEIRVFLIEQCIEDFNYHLITLYYDNFPSPN